jgi:cytochrome c553
MKIVAAITMASMLVASGAALAGDAAAGKATYQSKGCIGCHGADGKSTNPANPVLNGREADYIQQQLMAFRSGERQNATMNAMAAMLSDEDVANIAAYLSSAE